ncbi:MAG: lipid IV(A) 3-deoxy-D-manno-octulosonic acid transferase [Sulfurovaceae bacterium]|nr:lipid IV(A) 3-deoxy-D-manno-octulosonic acid transferase [Sulfurovaceae bacterium]
MYRFFFFLYVAVTALTWALALPFLWITSKLKSKHKESLPARFWLKNNKPFLPDGIWVHVCSFGEAKSIAPLINKIPSDLLRLSATTKTGFDEISKYTTQSRYLPFEPLLLRWVKPQKMLIVMEAELWYLLFAVARKKGAKTLLVNARMSEKSYSKYLRFKWLYRRIFEQIDAVYAQTDEDAARLITLGAKNIEVMGNIKFASITKSTKQLPKPEGIFVCAASTHDKEEALILDAFRALKSKRPEAKICVAPRHPERFDKVERIMESFAKIQGWSYHRWSQRADFQSDLVLFDTLGGLVNVYAISDVVVLGGAFEPIGGHNAAEAAQFGCKIISGKNYFNQKEIFAGIEGINIVQNDELKETLSYPNLLPNSSLVASANIKPILKQIKDVLQN